MKHIKKFEASSASLSSEFLGDYTPDRYWKISLSSPEYEISINKVVKNENYKKNYLTKLVLLKGLYPDSKYFYLLEDNGTAEYGSDKITISYHNSKTPYGNAAFMGKVEVTKEEIDEWWLEHDMEKYNL